MAITLTQAEKAIRVARALAIEKRFPPVNIAVVDDAAHLVGFARMDGALLGGIDVAEKKARTAALFHANTSVLAPKGEGRFSTIANRETLRNQVFFNEQ